MSNEVEKMYENAGINTIPQKVKDCNYCYYYEEAYDAPCYVCTADKCPFEKNIIPPFTAEKQISLIKLLQRKNGYKFSFSSTNDNSEYLFFAHKDNTPMYELIVAGDKYYEEALAGFINTLWQYLTPEEKQQVKEILK